MCLFGGGGGGGQPQVIYKDVYKDAPVAPLPAPLPTPMATGVESAQQAYADGTDPTNKSLGTSIFKINRDPAVASNDYQDQGLDSGLYY